MLISPTHFSYPFPLPISLSHCPSDSCILLMTPSYMILVDKIDQGIIPSSDGIAYILGHLFPQQAVPLSTENLAILSVMRAL